MVFIYIIYNNCMAGRFPQNLQSFRTTPPGSSLKIVEIDDDDDDYKPCPQKRVYYNNL